MIPTSRQHELRHLEDVCESQLESLGVEGHYSERLWWLELERPPSGEVLHFGVHEE